MGMVKFAACTHHYALTEPVCVIRQHAELHVEYYPILLTTRKQFFDRLYHQYTDEISVSVFAQKEALKHVFSVYGLSVIPTV
jgi:hypothetical protein